MKKILIVDNNSAHLSALKALVSEKMGAVEFRLIDPRDLTDTDMLWSQLVIFSGGQGRSIAKNPDTFIRMVDYVVLHHKPAIGICLGAEAIATYYGNALQENNVRRVGNVRIQFEDEFAIALSRTESSAMVYEFHKWFIPAVSKPLMSLATSKDGVEVLRHETLPLWGLQFHPEVRRKDNYGHVIFDYVLKNLEMI